MASLEFEIVSLWPGRPDTPSGVARKFLATLDTLSAGDSLFQDWGCYDNNNVPQGWRIEALRPDFTAFVERHVYRDELGEPFPSGGYQVWATSRFVSGSLPNPQSGNFLVDAGSAPTKNLSTFKIGPYPDPPPPDLITYRRFRLALTTIVAVWAPAWSNASCWVPGLLPATTTGDPSFPYSQSQIPWIAYLDAERSKGLETPPDLPTEQTPDGGLLMIAAETTPDLTNAAFLRNSKAIAEILIDRADPRY